jgi:putative transposase
MKKSRFKEEQIVRILGELEAGQTAAATSRKHGVSEQTIYRWKSKYGGMDKTELRQLKRLEEENSRLKRIVAQQAMDLDALKELLGKKW